jgi:hypothetical protein
MRAVILGLLAFPRRDGATLDPHLTPRPCRHLRAEIPGKQGIPRTFLMLLETLMGGVVRIHTHGCTPAPAAPWSSSWSRCGARSAHARPSSGTHGASRCCGCLDRTPRTPIMPTSWLCRPRCCAPPAGQGDGCERVGTIRRPGLSLLHWLREKEERVSYAATRIVAARIDRQFLWYEAEYVVLLESRPVALARRFVRRGRRVDLRSTRMPCPAGDSCSVLSAMPRGISEET